jgi:hypothetical protein
MPDSIVKVDNLTSMNGTGIGIPDGTVASPGLKFTADGDSGLYRIGANDLAIAVNGAKAFEADPNTVSIFTGGVERFRIESTGQIKAVYESQVGTDYNTTMHNGYFCRAWVNFNGTGTVAIRASGNVSSITDNNTGDYTVNFTTAMPDANYSSVCTNGETQRKLYSTYGVIASSGNISANTASTCRLGVFDDNTNLPLDVASFSVGVFR